LLRFFALLVDQMTLRSDDAALLRIQECLRGALYLGGVAHGHDVTVFGDAPY
jgi:hypothetical protein